MTNTLHFSEWRNCIRAQRKVNLCAPGAPKGPKGRMVVRQYEIVCANDAGRAPRKYPAVSRHFNWQAEYFRSRLRCSLSACVYLYKFLLYSWQPWLFPPKYISKREKRCCHFFCVVPESFSAQNVQKHEHYKKKLILITSKVKKNSKNPR